MRWLCPCVCNAGAEFRSGRFHANLAEIEQCRFSHIPTVSLTKSVRNPCLPISQIPLAEMGGDKNKKEIVSILKYFNFFTYMYPAKQEGKTD